MAYEVSRAFRAMNTEVTAIIVAEREREDEAACALGRVETLFAEVEAALSRFRPESELSALNRAAGAPFLASPLLFEVVTLALEAARATDGLFDPTVLGALAAAGYDRSFELLTADAASAHPPPPSAPGSWRDVRLDPARRIIHLPPGCGLDLGGIGKGWAVDQAVEALRPFGSFAVDAGGDLYAAGTQADGSPWTVGVEDPRDAERDLLVLAVRDRAVATSSVARRRWRQGGQERHHLIDPRTGLPAESGVLSVTVVAGTVARAEVIAKVALLLGPDEGWRFLDGQPDTSGLLVLADGQVELSAGLGEARHVA